MNMEAGKRPKRGHGIEEIMEKEGKGGGREWGTGGWVGKKWSKRGPE